MRSVTPLPPVLSGNTIERLIRIDEALIYLVSGALEYLCDKEPFEETGSLTIEDAKIALSDMFWAYFQEQPAMIPIGTIVMYGAAFGAPPGWISCDGTAVSRILYADLFDVIGITHGAGNGTTTFNLPDLLGRSPMGRDLTYIDVGEFKGEREVALNHTQNGPHNHGVNDPGHSHAISVRGSGTAGGTMNRVNAPTQTTLASNLETDSTTTGLTTNSAGGGLPHNNVHPVVGLIFIIYHGVM